MTATSYKPPICFVFYCVKNHLHKLRFFLFRNAGRKFNKNKADNCDVTHKLSAQRLDGSAPKRLAL